MCETVPHLPTEKIFRPASQTTTSAMALYQVHRNASRVGPATRCAQPLLLAVAPLPTFRSAAPAPRPHAPTSICYAAAVEDVGTAEDLTTGVQASQGK